MGRGAGPEPFSGPTVRPMARSEGLVNVIETSKNAGRGRHYNQMTLVGRPVAG